MAVSQKIILHSKKYEDGSQPVMLRAFISPLLAMCGNAECFVKLSQRSLIKHCAIWRDTDSRQFSRVLQGNESLLYFLSG
jgi:hypothetical protein